MIILNTDHLSVLQYEGATADALADRLESSGDEIAATIVSVEEQMRGWLAAIHGARAAKAQIPYYERLQRLFQFFAKWNLLPFDEAAESKFEELRKLKLRLKTMDLKIASIALVHQAKLWSANLRDFQRVPGLVVEDWLHG